MGAWWKFLTLLSKPAQRDCCHQPPADTEHNPHQSKATSTPIQRHLSHTFSGEGVVWFQLYSRVEGMRLCLCPERMDQGQKRHTQATANVSNSFSTNRVPFYDLELFCSFWVRKIVTTKLLMSEVGGWNNLNNSLFWCETKLNCSHYNQQSCWQKKHWKMTQNYSQNSLYS